MSRSFTPQGWHNSPIAGKVHYQSSYEHKFMIWLDENYINWEKCKEKFPYLKDDGKVHNYSPDFYLSSFDMYIETKGMIRKNDPAKFAAFPNGKKLCLLGYEELTKLGIKVFNPGNMKVEDRDETKWPFIVIKQINDFSEIGELSKELKEKVSADKFFEVLANYRELVDIARKHLKGEMSIGEDLEDSYMSGVDDENNHPKLELDQNGNIVIKHR